MKESGEEVGLEDFKNTKIKGSWKPFNLYRIKFYEEKPVGISLPKTIAFKIVEAENSVKGDTVTGATKQAILDTGMKVQVPLFIKAGEEILVNTETGAYLSRKN
jgi:elongation factor P